MGVPVANSYGFFKPDNSVSIGNPSFLYWTAMAGDGKPLMIDENGKTHPAPWVPFTRAGCDVGAFSVANIEFENVPADIGTVFGTGSQQFKDANNILTANPNDNNFAHQKARQSVNTDWQRRSALRIGSRSQRSMGRPTCSPTNRAVIPTSTRSMGTSMSHR
jgi:hypothetical protein